MIERRSSSQNPEERQRALFYADLVTVSQYSIIDHFGPHKDLAKKLVDDANSMLPSLNLLRQEETGEPPRYYFTFTSSYENQRGNEIIFSIGVGPIREPLIIVKTVKEIDGTRYQMERSLFTDKDGPLMTFWQASWEPKIRSSIPHTVQVNIDGAGLPIIGIGTPTEQRVQREKAFGVFVL